MLKRSDTADLLTYVKYTGRTSKKNSPYNHLPITHQRFKLILQYFAVVLNVYIDMYLPSYFSIWLPVRKILQIKCSYLKIFTLRTKLSGAVYCNRSCLWRAGVVTGGRAVSEPYYSQRARSVCVSLSAFVIEHLVLS